MHARKQPRAAVETGEDAAQHTSREGALEEHLVTRESRPVESVRSGKGSKVEESRVEKSREVVRSGQGLRVEKSRIESVMNRSSSLTEKQLSSYSLHTLHIRTASYTPVPT